MAITVYQRLQMAAGGSQSTTSLTFVEAGPAQSLTPGANGRHLAARAVLSVAVLGAGGADFGLFLQRSPTGDEEQLDGCKAHNIGGGQTCTVATVALEANTVMTGTAEHTVMVKMRSRSGATVIAQTNDGVSSLVVEEYAGT